MTETQRRRPLKIEPTPEDENLAEQFAASLARIEAGVSSMLEAVESIPPPNAKKVAFTVEGPEPEWVRDLRERHAVSLRVASMVVIVPRGAVAEILEMFDRARGKR